MFAICGTNCLILVTWYLLSATCYVKLFTCYWEIYLTSNNDKLKLKKKTDSLSWMSLAQLSPGLLICILIVFLFISEIEQIWSAMWDLCTVFVQNQCRVPALGVSESSMCWLIWSSIKLSALNLVPPVIKPSKGRTSLMPISGPIRRWRAEWVKW